MIDRLIYFLKELPTIWLVIYAFTVLITLWVVTRERELLILANLALGAILGIARAKTPPSQDIETQNIDKVILPDNTPGGGSQ